MKTYSGKFVLINSKPLGGSLLTYWEITGAPSAPVLSGYNIPVSAYDDPPPLASANGTYVTCGGRQGFLQRSTIRGVCILLMPAYNWAEPTDRSVLKCISSTRVRAPSRKRAVCLGQPATTTLSRR